jgi:type 1 glutamine amidotransferase/nicotinamidase-related amidase
MIALGLAFLLMSGPLSSATAATVAAKTPIHLPAQRRDATGAPIVTPAPINPARTAVIVIDMWDRHWCKTYTARVANLVPRMNQTLAAARQLGIQVVFAPSDVIDFYRDHPRRQAMTRIPAHPEPPAIDFNPGPEPAGLDCCECGPDRPCRNGRAWTRQQAGLEITETDLIGDCNNAAELFSLCAERGIDTLIYMGVASNMCVCHRSFGMLNARRHGYRLLFVSDLVEAITANGFNPERKEPDWNFTPAKGTARTQRYLEQNVAPSIESRALLRAAHLGPNANDTRPHIVFVTADDEYKTEATLPAFARAQLEPAFRCTFLSSQGNEPPGRHVVPGLEALADADLLVLSMRRRALSVPQMDHLERYLRAGKPIVALRLGIVPFQADPKDRADGHVIWRDFDREVLGCRYSGYNAEARNTGTDVWVAPGAPRHPVLDGLEAARFHSPSWIYRVNPLEPDTTVLLEGRWSEKDPVEPVAWTRQLGSARIFYTCLGHWEDFSNPSFRRLLDNGIRWALAAPNATTASPAAGPDTGGAANPPLSSSLSLAAATANVPLPQPQPAPLQWPTPAAEFFVATNGVDANPGTRSSPFATLERARDAVRAFIKQSKAQAHPPAGGVTVWIRGGSYPARAPFVLGPEDSGTETAPIAYRAWPGESPVFTGGVALRKFDPVSDATVRGLLPAEAREKVVEVDLTAHGVTNLWPLRLGGFSSGLGFRTHPMMELYFNDVALPIARGPNATELKVADVSEKDGHQMHGLKGSKTGRFTYGGDQPSKWQAEPELLLYGYWFWDWADSYERVVRIDPEKREITLDPPYHTYGYRPGQPFHAVNAISELDRPGEWCLDRGRSRIYFWPPSDPSQATVQLSAANFVFLQLDNVSDVAFERLTWQFGCRDAMRITGGQRCRLAGCTVQHFAGNGVEIQGGTNHGLRSCDIRSLGRGGVTLEGGDRKRLTPGNHYVENCHIHDLSRIDHTYTPAVLCSGVGQRIAHNWFHDILSSAIRCGGNDHVVEFNEVARTVLESDDQGGVDMFGDATFRGNVYRYNYFHHIGSRWYGLDDAKLGQAGIRLDDAISGTLIHGNIFYLAGGGGLGFGAIQIHGGKDNGIENNLFVNCPAAVSFSPWGDNRWRAFVTNALDAPAVDRSRYIQRYPDLERLPENHDVNGLTRNAVLRCPEFTRRDPRRGLRADNCVVTNTVAFPQADRGLFPEARQPGIMSQFGLDPIPFEAMGLYRDPYRPALPERDILEMRATGKGKSVGPTQDGR